MEVPITFYPSKIKSFFLFLISLIFVFLALYINKTEEIFYWLCLVLFGLGAVIFLLQILFPKSFYLKITEKGIEIKSLFKSSFMSWEIIKDFEVGKIHTRFRNKKMIMINFEDSYSKQIFGRNLAKLISGYEGALPDNYGMKHEELVKILNKYKNKFKIIE